MTSSWFYLVFALQGSVNYIAVFRKVSSPGPCLNIIYKDHRSNIEVSTVKIILKASPHWDLFHYNDRCPNSEIPITKFNFAMGIPILVKWHLYVETAPVIAIIPDDVIKWKHFPRYWPFMRETSGHGWFAPQRPVTLNFDVFFNLCLK